MIPATFKKLKESIKRHRGKEQNKMSCLKIQELQERIVKGGTDTSFENYIHAKAKCS